MALHESKMTEGLQSSETGKKEKTRAFKSKVKIYKTIQQALEQGSYGHMFSTSRAGRLYVITRGREKQQAKGVPNSGARVAKGFTKGSATPSADWASIKRHAVRTSMKHGKLQSKRSEKVYGTSSQKKEK